MLDELLWLKQLKERNQLEDLFFCKLLLLLAAQAQKR